MIKKNIILMSLLAIFSSAGAEEYKIQINNVSSVTCSIQTQVNGNLKVDVSYNSHLGCMPLGLKRYNKRRQQSNVVSNLLMDEIDTIDNLTCSSNNSYELKDSCGVLSLTTRSLKLKNSISCNSTDQNTPVDTCLPITACKKVIIEFLSDNNIISNRYLQGGLTAEEFLQDFDKEYMTPNGCVNE